MAQSSCLINAPPSKILMTNVNGRLTENKAKSCIHIWIDCFQRESIQDNTRDILNYMKGYSAGLDVVKLKLKPMRSHCLLSVGQSPFVLKVVSLITQ